MTPTVPARSLPGGRFLGGFFLVLLTLGACTNPSPPAAVPDIPALDDGGPLVDPVEIFPDYSASTYFLAVDGDDSADGSAQAPWATFLQAWSVMKEGDTLVLKDGVYKQPIERWYGTGFPNGFASRYTTIKAEHDSKVTIDASDLTDYKAAFRVGGDAHTRFVRIEGLRFRGNNSTDEKGAVPFTLERADHIKVLRCAFYDSPVEGNVATVGAGSGCSYVLFEECWAWGTGRYKFIAFGDENGSNNKTIFRRCVSRFDFQFHSQNGGTDWWGGQCATYTLYDAHNFLLQNCISIDSGDFGGDGELKNNPHGLLYAGVWFENKGTTGLDNSGEIRDSLFINLGGLGALNDHALNGNRVVSNTVIWNVQGAITVFSKDRVPSFLYDHLTIGKVTGVYGDESRAWGTGVNADANVPFAGALIRNSNLFQANSYALANSVVSNYNNFSGNAALFGHSYGVEAPVAGTDDRFDPDQVKHLPRVESTSTLRGRGSDGGDIGATIAYQRGVPGTLYGEPGYDDLTDIPLWPFPNEAQIKLDMGSTPIYGNKNDPQRGFCAPVNGLNGKPLTLTSYIWEQTGTACPPEVYGSL